MASASEGEELRGILPESAIYVFEGARAGRDEALLAANLVPVLNSTEQIRRWRSVAPGKSAVVHIDTGMSRLGLSAAEVAQVAEEALLDGLKLEYVITHLACADESSHRLTAADNAGPCKQQSTNA